MAKRNQNNGHTHVQWWTAITANMTLLTFGLQVGWISPMTKVLQSSQSPTGKPLSDNELSWVASTLSLSAVFGVSLFAYIADTRGRKVGVVIIALLQMISWIIKLLAASPACLIVARVFAGIPAGGCFNLIPMYVKEISQDEIRGQLGCLLFLFQNLGIFIMYAMGSYFGYSTVLWISLAVSITNILLMIRAPESPNYLAKFGKINEAITTVAYLRGLDSEHKTVQNEVSTMKNEELYYQGLPEVTFRNIFTNPAWRRGMLLIVLLMQLASCNGGFAIMTYASTIMMTSGVTFRPELQTLSIPVVTLLGSFISLLCVEKCGRKIILATAFFISAASHSCLASTLLAQAQGSSAPWWLPIIAVLCSVCANAAGVSPIPFIVMSEMFNFQIRAKVLGCLVTYSWFISFVQVAAFGPVLAAVGPYMTFYGFAAINLLGVFVTLVLLPETKAKSAEQIEMELKK